MICECFSGETSSLQCWLMEGTRQKKYRPLLDRPRCESLESRIQHFVKRGRLEQEEGENGEETTVFRGKRSKHSHLTTTNRPQEQKHRAKTEDSRYKLFKHIWTSLFLFELLICVCRNGLKTSAEIGTQLSAFSVEVIHIWLKDYLGCSCVNLIRKKTMLIGFMIVLFWSIFKWISMLAQCSCQYYAELILLKLFNNCKISCLSYLVSYNIKDRHAKSKNTQ